MSVMHVALFRWTPEVTGEQVDEFEKALATMPAAVGCLKSFRFGRDLGEREANFDFGVVAELESADQIHSYLDHPAHVRLVEEYVQKMLAERKAVQFEFRAARPSISAGANNVATDDEEERNGSRAAQP